MMERPYLLDVTRHISLRWTQRRETGIDRVCSAYLRHFAAQSHAVVQHRGAFRILDARQTDELFDLVATPQEGFRRRFVAFASSALIRGTSRVDGRRAIYLNVSHTDFDLDSHVAWTRSCDLRAIYLIHDLIPIRHAHHCRAQAVHRHRGRVVNALNTAAGIIVNSRATHEDLAQFAQTNCMRLPHVVVAPLAGAALAAPASGRRPLATPYFLCVGTIESRKNHMLLLRIWLKMVEDGAANIPALVIIGQWGARSVAVRRFLEANPVLSRHVTVLDHCPDADMARWMAHAQALLLPTLAEGFGLPLVEALSMGTPAIASDLPCFRESGQGIPLLLRPDDEAQWAAAIDHFASNAIGRRRQKAMARTYLPPTWADHFRRVDRWLGALDVKRPARRPIREGAELCG